MSIIAREPESQYTPCPEGLYQAVCVDVVDKGVMSTPWGDKHKIRLVWQVEEEDEAGHRYRIGKLYNLTLAERATLRKDLECWRGRKFTRDELAGFDLEVLLGVNCQLQVVHNVVDDGKTYANVQAIMAPPKGAVPLRPLDYTREIDREEYGDGPTPPPADEDPIPF